MDDVRPEKAAKMKKFVVEKKEENEKAERNEDEKEENKCEKED